MVYNYDMLGDITTLEMGYGTEQTLFLGEGSREDYGCIRFFGRPFDVTESYMRLMLDAAEE